MRRCILLVPAFVALATTIHPSLAADKAADPAYKMRCTSTSTKSLPRGSAGAGSIEFTVEVDPAAQSVVVDGKKRSAKIDQYEVAFADGDSSSASISRSMKTFGVVVSIDAVPHGDSRKYLYYQGKCKAA